MHIHSRTKSRVYRVSTGLRTMNRFSGASHGTKRLTDAEIERAYGRCRKKHPGSDYTQHLSEHGPANMVAFHPLLHSFMDYFDIAAPLLCARIVDVIDQINNAGRPMDEYSFWPDVQEGLRDMFMRTNFASDRGGYFPEMKVSVLSSRANYTFTHPSYVRLHPRPTAKIVKGVKIRRQAT